MRTFEKTIKIGTRVLLNIKEWATVSEIHETRKWVKVKEWKGSFQRNDILKYTNK